MTHEPNDATRRTDSGALPAPPHAPAMPARAPSPAGAAGAGTAAFNEFQWQLLEIRADIEQRKLEGSLSQDEELQIVLDALHLINLIQDDSNTLGRAQKIFWEADGLAVPDRIQKLWEAVDLFIG